jgi:succinate dehydrogenase / fumarate reductase, cytochrome b subunit
VPDPAPDPRRRTLAARAFSLSGVVPLGVFLVLHAALNARALGGELPFARAVGWMERVPLLPVVEGVFVFLPLAVHAALGMALVVKRRSYAEPSPYPRGVRIAMHATGVIVLAFLAMHLPELRFRVPGVRPDAGQLLTFLGEDLSSMRAGLPWRGALYLLGSACATFHLVVGLWGYFVSSGRGGTERVRRIAAWWAAAVGAALWTLFVAVTVFHSTGARILGGEAEIVAPAEPCPEAHEPPR